MTYIKKLFKNITLSFALLFCLTLAVPAGINYAALAADVNDSNVITIEGFESSARVGQDYTIKKGYYGAAKNEASIKVEDQYGNVITPTTTGVSGDVYGKIKPDSVGTYFITYSYKTGSGESEVTYSQKMQVQVTKASATFEFPENVKEIIPSKIGQDFAGTITLPMPKVLDEKDKEVANANVSVTVLDPKQNPVNLETNESENPYFTADSLEIGKYTITYKYKTSDDVFIMSQEKIMEVLANYDNDFKIGYDFTGSVPSDGKLSVSTGVTKVLPGVKAINKKTNETVESYFSVKVEREETVNGTTKWVDVTNSTETIHGKPIYNAEKNEFTPTKDGNYRFIYTVKDFFGHEAEYTGATLTAPKVEDKEKPTPLVVDADKEYTECLSSLKNKYSKSNVKIYAVGAEDNASINREDFEFTLRIFNSGSTKVFETTENVKDSSEEFQMAGKNLIFNYEESSFAASGNGTINDNNVVVLNKMNHVRKSGLSDEDLNKPMTLSAGTYTVYYVAKDKAGNENSVYYTFEIKEGEYATNSIPKVSFQEAFYTSYKPGDKITFSKPTATDEDDTRMDVITSYKFSDGVWTAAEYDEDKKVYVIDIDENTSATSLQIKAEATNDYGKTGDKIIDISIENTGDNDTPVVTKIDNYVANDAMNHTQNDNVKLPAVTFTDDKPEYMNVKINITYTGADGTSNIVARDAKITRTKGTITVSDAIFTASFAGDYQVSFVATDGGNNVKVVFFNYKAKPVTVVDFPQIDKNPTEINNGEAELGESIKIPAIEVKFNASNDRQVAVWEVVAIKSPGAYELNNNYFKPLATGTYHLQYQARIVEVDESGNIVTSVDEIPVDPSKVYTIKVSDTKGPTLEEFDIPSMVQVNYELDIPKISAYDISGVNMERSKITLSSNKFGSKELTTKSAPDDYKQKLTKNDVYSLTYLVYDNNGVSTTKTYTIKVGDTESPTIEVDDKIMPSKIKLNDKLSFDLSKIKVYDNISEVKVSNVKITVKNTSTNEEIKVSDDGTYLINKAGSYEVIFSITDDVGNEGTSTKTFTIDTNDNKGSVSTEVVGTILIVVSVLILAGVIVYFIVSSHKAKKSSKKKNTK